MRSFLFGAFLFAVLAACNTTTTTESSTAEASSEQDQKQLAITGETFGASIQADGAVSYDELLNDLENTDSMAVKVRAKVTDVCQMKGCWINVVNKEGQPEMFVKFKDYGFFMPKDIAGREVIMEGYAFRELTSVDELRHYAEDEGKSAEEVAAITEPVEELKFMASGVLLIDEKTAE
ncbi:MAG: DUF4920 domain-containing protein [Bacteroidota bacterium]